MAEMGIASQVQVPQSNPLQTLMGLEQFRKLQQENVGLGQVNQQRAIDQEALKDYGTTGNLLDMRRASPEMYESAARGATTNYNLGSEKKARDAYEVLNTTDPIEKKKKWQEKGDEWVKNGWLKKEAWSRMRDNPSDLVLQNVIKNSMDVQKHMQATGVTAEREAAGRALHEPKVSEQGQQITFPATRPGAPNSPIGDVTAPSDANQSFNPPRAQPIQAPSTRSDVDRYNSSDQNYRDAPSKPLAPPAPSGPGVVQQGVHPLVASAAQEGLKKLTEHSTRADAAARDEAELNSLQAGIDSGRARTGMFTETKMHIAAAIYGATGDARLAAGTTGVDLPALEVFVKDATRRGLTFARQTEGAREAVMAIQIALRANPSLANTEAGNRKMIEILRAGDKYDQDLSRAAQSYYMKQQDTTGGGHLVGFEDWYLQKHHPGMSVSKVMPYPVPRNQDEWKDGYTYEVPVGQDRNGKTITSIGTWNSRTQTFDPVRND